MQVSASEFKAHCLELFKKIENLPEEIIITRHGKPIAKVVPIDTERRSLFGLMQGTLSIVGDIVKPLDNDWEANQ